MTAVAGSEAVWYLMRASGFVALVFLSLTVALGVVGVERMRSERWPKYVTSTLHRNLSLLAVTFLAVHIATAVLDSWVHIDVPAVVVPFLSGYRPFWVGLGAVAVDLLVAVMATSLLRRHVGPRVWRAVHWATWVAWPVAFVHALGIGTDSTSGWGLAISLACVAVVSAAAVFRVTQALARRARRNPRAPGTHLPHRPADPGTERPLVREAH